MCTYDISSSYSFYETNMMILQKRNLKVFQKRNRLRFYIQELFQMINSFSCISYTLYFPLYYYSMYFLFLLLFFLILFILSFSSFLFAHPPRRPLVFLDAPGVRLLSSRRLFLPVWSVPCAFAVVFRFTGVYLSGVGNLCFHSAPFGGN